MQKQSNRISLEVTFVKTKIIYEKATEAKKLITL